MEGGALPLQCSLPTRWPVVRSTDHNSSRLQRRAIVARVPVFVAIGGAIIIITDQEYRSRQLSDTSFKDVDNHKSDAPPTSS